MITFFIYLFKVSCWVAVWWLIYHIFLRKETFYTFNRFYLMSGLVASFLIPLMKIYYPVEIFITQNANSTVAEKAHTQSNVVMDTYSVLFYVYLFFVAFFIIRQIFLLLKINGMIRSAGYKITDEYRLVDSIKTKIPFSFFKYIFINSGQHPEKEKQLIIAHESSHIIQRHWADLVISECICILLWFNPFVWLYLRSVKENHEYLADEAVICNGYSPVYYRATLINQSLNTTVFPLVNSFAKYNFKRISMMKKETSNPLKKLTVMLLIPVVCFFLWAFSEPEYLMKTIEAPQQTEVVYIEENASAIIEKQDTNKTVKTQIKVVIQKDTIEDKKEEINIEKIEASQGETHVLNGTYITCDSTNVSVNIFNNGSSIETNSEGKSSVFLIRTKRNNDSTDIKPLIIVDGKKFPLAIKDIDPKGIHSITVLKDESSSRLYGEKGKNGVIIIETKAAKKTDEEHVIDITM